MCVNIQFIHSTVGNHCWLLHSAAMNLSSFLSEYTYAFLLGIFLGMDIYLSRVVESVYASTSSERIPVAPQRPAFSIVFVFHFNHYGTI